MRTLLGPDRTAVWLSERVAPPIVGLELFLSDGQHLRCSVGVLYNYTDSRLVHVGVIREDARGFDTDAWNGPEETFETLSSSSSWDVLTYLRGDERTVMTTCSVQVTPQGLVQTESVVTDPKQQAAHVASLVWGMSSSAWQTTFRLSDQIHLSCPTVLPTNNNNNNNGHDDDDDDDAPPALQVAVAWQAPDGRLAATIQMTYTDDGTMDTMTYTKFTTPPDRATPDDSSSKQD